MSHFDTAKVFTARLAPAFENEREKLYEVITPDGERIASATNLLAVQSLAESLNSNVRAWAEHIGFDAVLAA